MYRPVKYCSQVIGLIFISFILFQCTVKYVAEYDATVKEEIVQIAKKVDLFWGNLLDTEINQRSYDLYKDRYNEIETELRGLLMKNEIRPLNEESTKQAQILLDLWIQDKEIHKESNSFPPAASRASASARSGPSSMK